MDKKNMMTMVRELVTVFDKSRLDRCLNHSIENNPNSCVDMGENSDNVNILAKAVYIREKVDGGETVNNAIRELGRRMRQVQVSDD